MTGAGSAAGGVATGAGFAVAAPATPGLAPETCPALATALGGGVAPAAEEVQDLHLLRPHG